MVDTANGNLIKQRTVLCSIKIGSVSNSRKIDPKIMLNLKDDPYDNRTGKIDPRVVTATKKLIDSDILRRINTRTAKLKLWMQNRTVATFHKSGTYVLPVGLFREVNEEIKKCKAEIEPWINEFIDSYEDIKQDMVVKLGPVFNRDDYVPKEELRDRFTIDVMYVTFDTPDNIKEYDPEAYEQEKSKITAMLDETRDKINLALATQFKKAIKSIADRVRKRSAGERTQFRSDMLDDIKEFFDLFPKRNVNDNEDLGELVRKAEKVLGDSTAIDLKADLDFAEVVAGNFTEIEEQLNNMISIVDNSERSFVF